MRVLIADADEKLLLVLQSYLWRQGHQTEIATDGLECTALLHQFVPDVIVLDRDLLWGGSDGVIAHMQDDPRLRDVPVILVADDRGQFQSWSTPPIAAWLRKPFRLDNLLAEITTLGRRSLATGR